MIPAKLRSGYCDQLLFFAVLLSPLLDGFDQLYLAFCVLSLQSINTAKSERIFLPSQKTPELRFEPGPAGGEARTLPLCYVDPPPRDQLLLTERITDVAIPRLFYAEKIRQLFRS